MSKSGYGQYLLALLREPYFAARGQPAMKIDETSIARRPSPHAQDLRDSAASSSRPGTCARWRKPACLSTGPRTTSPSRTKTFCAASTIRSSSRRESSCALPTARSSTWQWICAAARPTSASTSPSSSPAKAAEMLWIPVGFGHGFLVLSEVAGFAYKATEYYCPRRAHHPLE